MDLPLDPNEFEEFVEPYDVAPEPGSSHLSTVVPSDVVRLIEIILDQDLGYISKSDFVRDCVIKWIIVLTESIKQPEYKEYLISATRMRASHAAQVRRTRQLKGEDVVVAAEEELAILIDAKEWEEATKVAIKQIESIVNIGGSTTRIWMKTYSSNPKIQKHLLTLINKNTSKSDILKGILIDLNSLPTSVQDTL